MAETWRYIINTFDSNTRASRPVAYSFFTDFKAKIEAGGLADPELLIIHGDYVPFYDALKGIYLNMQLIEGEYEGRTLGFEDLLELLNDTSHLRKWEGKVRGEFPEDSPTEREIFPNKRAPFQTGTYENRVLAVGTLAQKLLQYPALAATQVEVLSFYNLMESTREAQQNHEGSLANLRVLFENQRVIVANEVFGAYGKLCYKFRNNRPMITTFFDMEILQSSSSDDVLFDDEVGANTIENITEDFNADQFFQIENNGTMPMWFYTSDSPATGYQGWGVQVQPGENLKFNVTELGGLRQYLNVHNQNGTAGSCIVSLTEE
jgi:hypothetical protein